MSQKIEKPSLTGPRIKTRKRDEKEKYDPTAFRDAIIQGLTEAGDDLEQVSKFLDSAGSRLDYRRYAEPLFDVLFAGGILAPGGSLLQDAGTPGIDKVSRYSYCIFEAQDEPTSLRARYEVLYKLIRRYKYLEKSFEEELKKLILFLRGFTAEERAKLAKVVGYCLANGLGNAACFTCLFDEHLVKDGISVEFTQDMFKIWLQEKDIQNIANALKRSGVETKLLELLPINKRTMETFETYFMKPGLEPIVEYQRVKATAEMRKGVQTQLETMMRNEEPIKEMITLVKDHMSKNGMVDHEVVLLVWNTIMNSIEWNKKEELVGEQSLKHLKQYSPLLAAVTESGRAELALINKVQEYCYDNMDFLKVFSKIIVLFYKTEVLSEDAIMKWYSDVHTSGHQIKGKSIFLDQMKKFIEWLKHAEEESEEDDD